MRPPNFQAQLEASLDQTKTPVADGQVVVEANTFSDEGPATTESG